MTDIAQWDPVFLVTQLLLRTPYQILDPSGLRANRYDMTLQRDAASVFNLTNFGGYENVLSFDLSALDQLCHSKSHIFLILSCSE